MHSVLCADIFDSKDRVMAQTSVKENSPGENSLAGASKLQDTKPAFEYPWPGGIQLVLAF